MKLQALQILTRAFVDQKCPGQLKVLLVGSTTNTQMLTSKLKSEGYAIANDLLGGGLLITTWLVCKFYGF